MDLFRSIRMRKKEHFIDIIDIRLIECEEQFNVKQKKKNGRKNIVENIVNSYNA